MNKAFQQISNNRRLFFPIIINSTITYILAFLFTFFVYQAVTTISAASCNIHVGLKYNGIRFLTGDYSSLWTADSAFIVFISGPVVSIILGFVSLFISISLMGLKSNLKMFFLWTSLHFFNRVLSFFILGNILFLYGPNLILDWMYFDDAFKIVFSGIAFILLFIIGLLYTSSFLHSANNINLIKPAKRLAFLMSQALFPFLAGNIFILIFFLPKIPLVEILINLFLIVSIAPLFLNYRKFSIIDVDEPIKIYPVNMKYILFLAGITLLYRILLIKEISF